jgi:predicted amidohydrolase YtcJ
MFLKNSLPMLKYIMIMKQRLYMMRVLPFLLLAFSLACNSSRHADMILINGMIITVDRNFTIAEAVAIEKGNITAVGSNAEIRKLADRKTMVVDLRGKAVIPGLMDAHLHPESASLSELNGEIPDLHTIAELLDWIKSQVALKKPGEWINHPKLFFTRLKDLRQPTLAELDHVAPLNPVFLNGSFGGMINSAAMKASGISAKTIHPGILHDKNSGLLTGFIRASAFPLLKLPPEKVLSYDEKLDALEAMLHRYNRMGITSLCSGAGDFENFNVYRDLHLKNRLTARIFQNILLSPDSARTLKMILDTLKSCKYATGFGDEWTRIGALKIVLDGGILTGTAYLREPWGDKARNIFGIEDTRYRGILNYTRSEVRSVVAAATELNWKFTVHCTGGGGVDLLLDVFEEINRENPIKERRFSIIHGNFFTADAIKRMSRLGIYADMQPAWFFKDADAMRSILGDDRIRSFHPYRSLLDAGVCVNGGSDHMVKWDANTSINPYNPFLAMWTMITRTTERGSIILPEEAISREDALKIYTINNAYASFEETRKGSIEPGKLADMAVISDDILTCPVDQIKNIRSELTIVGGEVVYCSGKVLRPERP